MFNDLGAGQRPDTTVTPGRDVVADRGSDLEQVHIVLSAAGPAVPGVDEVPRSVAMRSCAGRDDHPRVGSVDRGDVVPVMTLKAEHLRVGSVRPQRRKRRNRRRTTLLRGGR